MKGPEGVIQHFRAPHQNGSVSASVTVDYFCSFPDLELLVTNK